MSQINFWQRAGLISAIVLSSSVLGASIGSAQSDRKITTFSLLTVVKPTDWAFTSLRSFVENHDCITGYPSLTFIVNRPVTRYEFTESLSVCLDKINELVSDGFANKFSKQDLAALQRLQEEFAGELAIYSGQRGHNVVETKTASQLVKPTDASYLALPRLVRYGCFANYPEITDGKKQRPLTRYEYAVSLNACMDAFNYVLGTELAERVGKEDLGLIQKLQVEFAAELTSVRTSGDSPKSMITRIICGLYSPPYPKGQVDRELNTENSNWVDENPFR